jgi:hypothetical protein
VRNSPVGKVDPLGQFDEWVEDIAPLDEQPVNDSTGNPLDGTSRFMASDVVGCICVGDTFSRMKIHCTLGARPSTRYTPDFFSDENRGILVRTHEWNHYEVWTEHYLPSYRDLFSRFAGDECCNCLERAAEFTALWRQLKDKLLRWERYQEYGDLRGPHRQPRFDYGTGYGSLSSIVNEVAAGIKTSCK